MPIGAFKLNTISKLLDTGYIRTAVYTPRTWGTDDFQVHNFSKFGSRSVWFPGIVSSNFFELGGITDSLKFSVGARTWEAWVYPIAWTANTATGESSANIMGNSGYDGWGYNNFGFNNAGKLTFGYAYNNSFSTFHTIQETGTSGVLNQWQHIALVQTGGVITLYHNGVQKASSSIIGTPGYDFGNQRGFCIGVNSSSFRGYIDDLRISSTARYSGSSFTAPTTAFVNDENTIALFHYDNNQLINPSGGYLSGWDDGGSYSPGTAPTSVTAVSLVDGATSTASTMNIPAYALANDYAILFDTSTTTTLTVPSGWTQIGSTTTTGIRSTISYKKLGSGEAGTTITGMAGTTRKVMLIVRPNAPVGSITLSTPTQQATTAVPTNQTIALTGVAQPVMGFAHYSSTGAITTRTGSGNTKEFSSSTNQYVKIWTYNYNTPASQTVGMSDGGTNALQSFYLKFNA